MVNCREVMESRLEAFTRFPVGLGRKAVVETQANDPNERVHRICIVK